MPGTFLPGFLFHNAKQNIPGNFIIDKDEKVAVSSTNFTEKEFEEIFEKVDELLKYGTLKRYVIGKADNNRMAQHSDVEQSCFGG